MEIKTTKEIHQQPISVKVYTSKRWVSVDSLLEVLNDDSLTYEDVHIYLMESLK